MAYRTFFGHGFRPFFLGAGVWAPAVIVVWLFVFQGDANLPTGFDPLAWHAHEMLFGFAFAAVAGFLLTAIPNWTKRLPVSGAPLALLFGLWLVGRGAMALSGVLGPAATAFVDMAFPLVLLFVAAREVMAERNWRNMPVIVAVALMVCANALMHAEAAGVFDGGGMGRRLGIGTLAFLIALVGGRIVPSFTHNWLMREGDEVRPAPFGMADRIALLLLAAGLVAWIADPEAQATGVALLAAGAATLFRLVRWHGERTLDEPLVWSLHLGFAWMPVGLILLGASAFDIRVPPSAGLHALTVGAIGGMILAVMTRATLGHTGRPLHADLVTTVIYLLAALGAALRIASSLTADPYDGLLWAGGSAWSAAFVLFVLRYGWVLYAPAVAKDD
jgi:uncharacterized protein involved in response to NO